jgi:hypothetical protein
MSYLAGFNATVLHQKLQILIAAPDWLRRAKARKAVPLACFLFLLFTSAAPSARAQIWQPEYGPLQVGVGYQYSHYNVFGRSFHNNGESATFAYRVFDPLTGASSRISAAIEGTVMIGLGGHTSGFPALDAKSIFVGGGPHLTLENKSRVEPWVHVLVGLDHLRFTQTSTIGSNNAFGFVAGGGADVTLGGRLAWRIQGDYIGTHFQSWIQSNYSIGTGLVVRF